MTLTLKNNDALALNPGRKTGSRFVAMLLLTLGLVLSGLQPVFAQPPTAYTWTISPIRDNQVYTTGSDAAKIVATPPTTTPPTAPFNGPVTVKIKDASGGSISVVVAMVDGVATVPFTNDAAGVVTFEVDVYPPTFPAVMLASRPFTFLAAPGPPDLNQSFVVVNRVSSPADGTTRDQVSAYLFDVDGNPINTGYPVTFTLDPGAPVTTYTNTATTGLATTVINQASAWFTSFTAGTYNVTVMAGGMILYDRITGVYPSVINFTALPPDPTKSYIKVTTNNSPDNNSTADVVTAYLFDQFGNPVTDGTPVTFQIDPVTTIPVTNPNGPTLNCTTGTVGAQFISPAPGAATIEATITVNGTTYTLYDKPPGGYPPTDPTANPFVVANFASGPADPDKSYIVVTTDNSPDDGTTADVITVYLVDAQGFPVNQSTQVSFGTPNGPATIKFPADQNQTVTGSTATSQYTSFSVNPTTVAVTINGDLTHPLKDQTPGMTPQGNPYATLHYTNTAISLTNSYIIVSKDQSVANGVDQDIVTVYLYDQSNQPITDATSANLTFNIKAGGTITPTLAASSLTGTIQAQYTSTTTGYAYIQVLVAGTPLPDHTAPFTPPGNDYATIHFISGPPDLSKSYIKTTTDNAAATGNLADVDIVTVYLFDANNNPVDNGTYTITFDVKQTNGQPVSGQPAILGFPQITITTSGTVSYTSTLAGTFNATATYNGIAIKDQSQTNAFVPIHFVSGAAVPGDPGSGGSGGTPPGNGGTPPTGGGGSGPSGGNNGPGQNNGYTILYIQQPFDYALANGKQQDSLIAYITDINKNPVAGTAVTFLIQASPTAGTITSGAQFVGATTVTTDQYGYARIAMTSTTPGTVFVDATIVDPNTSNPVLIDGSYQICHFVPEPDVTNPLTTLTVVIGEALADGSQQTEVKAHIVDLNGDIMPNQPIYFAIDSGSGTIVTPQPVYTDANGDAYIYITSKTPGDVLITATVDDKKIIFGSPARVHFAPINIYVPRVFTPNNDGTNDVLKPILVGISEFHYFNIYNRWGNLVFTTRDPNQGWDGTFKGVPQPVETYLWIGEGVDVNGKKIVQRGMVSLAR